MKHRFISSILILGLLTGGGSTVASAEPAVPPSSDLGWVAAKAVVSQGAPSDINITVGGTADSAFISVTGYRASGAPGSFYTHTGTSHSSATCTNGSISERYSSTRLSGPGETPRETGTLKITSDQCGTGKMSGIIGLFRWGAPSDGYAKHSLMVRLYLPSHPDYATITSSPNVAVLPQIDDTSIYVDSLVATLSARYAATEVCLVLGEKVRTHSLRSSVPDVTLICNSQGLRAAIQFMMGLDSLEALSTLYDAANDLNQDPNNAQPDCDQISSIGTCLEEGMWDPNLPEPSPEPEPAPAGNGIRPPTNCMDPATRQQLEDTMAVQDHHLATHYGDWGRTFQRIADRYGLSVRDTAGVWNVRTMLHAGPHPWNYHDWVYQNMIQADQIAQEAEESVRRDVFLDEFTRTVSDVVAEDPTIVRAQYWKCRDDYRWR